MKPSALTTAARLPASCSRRLLAFLALLGIAMPMYAAAPRISVQYSEKLTIVGSTFTSKGSIAITAPTVGLNTYVTDFTMLGNGTITRFYLYGSVETANVAHVAMRVITVSNITGVTSYKFPSVKVTYSSKKGFSTARITFDATAGFSFTSYYLDFINAGLFGQTAPRGIATGTFGFPGLYHLGTNFGFPIAITIDSGLVKSLGTFDNPACIKVKTKNDVLQADVSGGGDWFYP